MPARLLLTQRYVRVWSTSANNTRLLETLHMANTGSHACPSTLLTSPPPLAWLVD